MSHAEVSIGIFDTTLRDGAQALPAENQFKPDSKPEIAHAIASLGVTTIEAGFPATPNDFEEVNEVARTVGNQNYSVQEWTGGVDASEPEVPVYAGSFTPVIAGLARTTQGDIESCWGAVQIAQKPRIHTFISTDADHMRAKFPGKTPEAVYKMGMQAVSYAKEISAEHNGASVEFSAEAASTTNTDFLECVIKGAIDAGADIVNVPDTVGQRTPAFMRQFYRKVIEWVQATNPSVTVSAHNHNDMGNAVASTFSLVEAAIEASTEHQASVGIQLETTICGLGERAGNADVFPVMANIFQTAPYAASRIGWQFKPVRSVEVANFVMEQAGTSVGRQSPIVGSDILVHRSGIHSDGIVKGGHRIYTPFDPTFWGHGVNAVHEDGKYQGTRGRMAIV